MSSNVWVTIASTTYNMETYIGEALDSWLAQETTFPFDIVVSDDGSTDGTCGVVRKYMEIHANIRPISTGYIGKMSNFIRSLKESKGRYIALCVGDNYWTDPLKLQKQVDFLEGHEEYSMCFHRVDVVGDVNEECQYTRLKE